MQHRIQKSYRQAKPKSFERLEARRLLAGDVSAFVDDGILLIVGDSQANQVQLVQSSDGSVTVEGIDTTVNGSPAVFTIADSFQAVTVSLGDGDDEASISDLSASRSVSFFGGNGGDRLELNNVRGRYVHIQGNGGDDVIEFNGVTDQKSTYVFLGDGNDVLAVEALSTGRNFKVFGGDGDDTFASASLSVGRKFRLNLENGNDQALLAGNTIVQKTTKVGLGSGDDFLGVLPQQTNETSVFRRHVKVRAGAGNDSVAFDAGVLSRKPSKFDGGAGTDSIETGGANINKHTRFRRFESSSISAAELNEQIDDVFARLATLGIDTEPFGDTDDSQPETSAIQLNVNSTDLSFTENDSPLNVDPAVEVISSANETIASATVQVAGGSANEDSLLFDDTAGITSNFDSATGILSLTGPATAAEFQAALRNVRFSNSSDNPSANDRTFTFSVQSVLSVPPLIADRRLRLFAVDDPLQLTLPGPFSEGSPINVILNEAVTFTAAGSDPDNAFVYQLDLDGSEISAAAEQPTIDSTTGIFTWSPSETGSFPIRVITTNDIGDVDQEEFTINVN